MSLLTLYQLNLQAASLVVTPGVLALTLTTFAPTVTTSGNQVVVPSTASLTMTTFAPTVTSSNQQVVVPGTATLTITTFAPTVTVAVSSPVCVPGTATLTITRFAPTVVVAAPPSVGVVPIRYVVGGTEQAVPVETVLVAATGVVPCRVYAGTANVVPVRETTEVPRVKIIMV